MATGEFARDDGADRAWWRLVPLRAMRTAARRDGGHHVVNVSKMWITRRSGLAALLCKTHPKAQPARQGISILLCDKREGLSVAR